jgi:N-formylglutamate amidohydrolase
MEVYVLHPAIGPRVPIIASVPHSGMYVPGEIARQFAQGHGQWLRNTDWYLPQLYSFLPELGVTMIEATHSRYVVDLNRDPKGDLHGAFTRAAIARETAQGAPVYAQPQDAALLIARLDAYHAPFHSALRALLTDTLERFGRALLLDLHSFMGPITADVCIGDRWGATCSEHTTRIFQAAFAQQGFDVVRNAPFAGGYIVQAYADPPNAESLQLELRYTNYLDCGAIDERRPQLDSERLAAAQARLRPAISAAFAACC